MIITTLSELPGRRYEALGLVSAACYIPVGMRTDAHAIGSDQFEAQAQALHADAVVDVRMQVLQEPSGHPGPPRVIVALLGTAVRFL
jgi:hypothetical protein